MSPRTEHTTPAAETLILSHGTAQSYYLTLDPHFDMAARPCMDDPLERASALPHLFSLFNTSYSGFGDRPIEVVVPDASLRRRRSGLITHSTHIDYPPGSFWLLRPSIYMVSPELCFVQMAKHLNEAQLIELGINLCAKYYLDPSSDLIFEREPITSAERLAAYVEKLGSAYRGINKARKALRWVIDNSASPMETRSAIFMHYEKSHGACGFPIIEANYEIDPGQYRHLTEQGYFSVDGAWPDKRTFYEYLGEKEHPDLAKDMRRLDALGALGWHGVTLNKHTLYNLDAFEVAARQIAQHLNKKWRVPADWREKQIQLRRDLGLLN